MAQALAGIWTAGCGDWIPGGLRRRQQHDAQHQVLDAAGNLRDRGHRHSERNRSIEEQFHDYCSVTVTVLGPCLLGEARRANVTMGRTAPARYLWIKNPCFLFRTAFGKLQFRDTFTTQNYESKGIRRAALAAIFPLPSRAVEWWRWKHVLTGGPASRRFWTCNSRRISPED